MSIPSASMRLQFHEGFTFDDAIPLIPYLANLGVSHLNVSPILTARAGSRSGDDVIDPAVVNPELGGEEGFRRLVAALRNAGLSIIVDIAPGFMAAGNDNPWWLDVLQHGRKSTYAHYFDIDWEPDDAVLKDKILLPVLTRPYGEALREGDITVAFNEAQDRYEIRYLGYVCPVDPAQRPHIERNTLGGFDARSFGGRVHLQALLEQQHFRLAAARSADDAINWRRLSGGNDLVALRVEEDDVFDATHGTILRLFADGLIDGVRIRHIDSLADPKSYCQRVRALLGMLGSSLGQRVYILVDKILSPGEELASDWDCDGATGDDFVVDLASLLHDRDGAEPLAQWWAALSERPATFAAEMEASRRETLEADFAAALEGAVSALHRLAQYDPMARDLPRPALRRGLIEILAHLRVYRTYAGLRGGSAPDKKRLGDAVTKAMATCLPRDRETIQQIAAWLGGEARAAGDVALHRDAIRRFQQLSAALAGRAADVAFYRHAALLAYRDPNGPRDPVEAFHRQAADRATRFPYTVLASTPEHTFGEDLRARLAVLSEVSQDWAETLSDWLNETEPFFADLGGARVPRFADAATLLQMLVGAWPLGLRPDDTEALRRFASRIAEWQVTALRAAKLATDTTVPNAAYEAAARSFLGHLFEQEWPARIAAFAERIAPAGAVNGLTQTLLKLTVPGVPDVGFGGDLWDQTVVERGDDQPIDFEARTKNLSARKTVASLAGDWRNGEVKQALIQEVLAARRAHFDLFAQGTYVPLQTDGTQAEHVIAFARQRGEEAAIVVASRLTAQWLDGSLLIPASSWDGTQLHLPAGFAQMKWRSLFTNRSVALSGDTPSVADLLDGFPVALLMTAK
ncbi:MAG TPA: malto-oligosyltrehalose synthase [Methylovirgula sp.]|nr:malto-oligosyltrehalose synthase [Methylovirgula sp.]